MKPSKRLFRGLPLAMVADGRKMTALIEFGNGPMRRKKRNLKPIPATEGDIPPPGYILADVEDEDGSRKKFWISPSTVKSSGQQRSELTQNQIKRIKAFKEALGGYHSATIEETLRDFSCDRNPETEIRVWEHITKVFLAELALRGECPPLEKSLLYKVVLNCSVVSPNTGRVMSTMPAAKRLPNLDRVVQTFRRTWNG